MPGEESSLFSMPIVGGEPEEEEEPILHPSLVAVLGEAEKIAARLANRIEKLRSILTSSDELKEILASAKTIRRARERLAGAAIDSTYPVEGGVELIGGLLMGVVAGYVLFSNACVKEPCREVYARAFFADTEDAKRKLQLLAKLLEKRVTLRVFERIARGETRARIVIFDGELIPYSLLFKPTSYIESHPILKRIDEVMASIMEAAREHRVILVGVVKRSYSRLLSAIAGKKLPLNDKALLSIALKPGTYVELGSFSELLPRYASIQEVKELREKLAKAVKERLEARKAYGEVRVVFYKPSVPVAYSQAVKIEVLDPSGAGVGRVIGLLDSLTNPATSIPYPVDLVDEYVRFESRMLELLRRKLLARLARQGLLSLSNILLGYTNPEKRYVFERTAKTE